MTRVHDTEAGDDPEELGRCLADVKEMFHLIKKDCLGCRIGLRKVVDLEPLALALFPWLLPFSELGYLFIKYEDCPFSDPSCFGVLEYFFLIFSWTKLTERFFKNTPWPEAETIAPQVGNGRCEYFVSCVLDGILWLRLIRKLRTICVCFARHFISPGFGT